MNNEQITGRSEESYEEAGFEDTREIGAKINERMYTFDRRLVLEDRFLTFIPEDFTEMPEELAKIKYPSGDRPKTILSDERGAVCFTFNTVDSPLENENVHELTEGIKNMLQKLNPSYLFYDSGILETEQGVKTGYTEYKSPALDDTVYNLMYFVPLDGITMMGTFSCPYGECEEWRPVVSEALGLTELVRKEEEHNV